MKYAVFGDIHGYLSEYLKTIDAIRLYQPDDLICLGDIVDGGDASDVVCKLIRHMSIRCVRGNHDEVHDSPLGRENQDWLLSLPISIIEHSVCFTHESPADPPRKINSAYEAWRAFDGTDHRIIVVGASHISKIYTDKAMQVGDAAEVPFEYGQPVKLDREARYVISPGAVGYTRDLVHQPKFGIIDIDEYTVTISTVELDTMMNNPS